MEASGRTSKGLSVTIPNKRGSILHSASRKKQLKATIK